jgi:hypothetical protein
MPLFVHLAPEHLTTDINGISTQPAHNLGPNPGAQPPHPVANVARIFLEHPASDFIGPDR